MKREDFYAYYHHQIELATLKKKSRRGILTQEEKTRMRALDASQHDERHTLAEMIGKCGDPQTRIMLVMRFLDFRSWAEIAQAMGGGNKSSGCRMRVERYIKRVGRLD